MSGPEGSELSVGQFERLTYPRLNLKDNTLDDNNLASACLFNNNHGSIIPQHDLGTLDGLALELLQSVLVQLDIFSLTNFRRVNRRALQIVDGLPQYKDIATYAPNILRGILSIETGRWITCETLFNTFCTAECQFCGDFGGYLYLLTCKRVCFLCLSENRACLPVSYGFAVRKLGITRQILDTLPHMKSIPGIYSPNERRIHRRLCLVDFESAQQAGTKFHGSTIAMERYVSDQAALRQQNFEKRLSQTISGDHHRTPRRPHNVDPFDGQSGNALRFMAVVQTPAFSRSTRELVLGSYCTGCQHSYDRRPRHFRRRFTETSFLVHLRECGPIRDGKHWNNEAFED